MPLFLIPLGYWIAGGIGAGAGFLGYRAVDQTADSVAGAGQTVTRALLLGGGAVAAYHVWKASK